MPRPNLQPLHVRLAEHSVPEPNTGCWLWVGQAVATNKQRPDLLYGVVSCGAKAKRMYAHRAAYLVAHGAIPTGAQVHHQCEQSLCVNPAHLVALAPGAHTHVTWRVQHKLTTAQVAEIRERAQYMPLASLQVLAEEYGVGHRHLADVLVGAKWRQEAASSTAAPTS